MSTRSSTELKRRTLPWLLALVAGVLVAAMISTGPDETSADGVRATPATLAEVCRAPAFFEDRQLQAFDVSVEVGRPARMRRCFDLVVVDRGAQVGAAELRAVVADHALELSAAQRELMRDTVQQRRAVRRAGCGRWCAACARA